jgi:hypothetical protein
VRRAPAFCSSSVMWPASDRSRSTRSGVLTDCISFRWKLAFRGNRIRTVAPRLLAVALTSFTT